MDDPEEKPCTFEATVPLEDTETACLLVTALSVDKEVRKELVSRTLEAKGSELHVVIRSADRKSLRGAVNAFMEAFELAVQVRNEFTLCENK